MDLAEVAGQVAGQLIERATRRRDVHEPEERGAQLVVARCQPHGLLVERPHRRSGARREGGGEVAADPPELVLEPAVSGHAETVLPLMRAYPEDG